MNTLSSGALARLVAEDFRRAHPGPLDAAAVQDLAVRIELAVRSAVRDERDACAAECARRQQLWTATEERSETPAALRAEARARANEAAVLADALRARGR